MKTKKPFPNSNSPIDDKDIASLNEQFKPLPPIERIKLLYHLFDVKSILYTSSFGTKSALLLYWISNLQAAQKIHFLDTGYHFEETLRYKDALVQSLNLEVVHLKPETTAHQATLEAEMWKNNTSKCCYINKVVPLELVKLDYDIWISGLMAYQTPFRRNLEVFEKKDNILKFYPLIDLSESDFNTAYQATNLPPHPLEVLGYHSIGCLHCTQRGKGRSGRWSRSSKTECGLHFN
ncbi:MULTISPECIES: phosphoadenylyl-sulfate reductase [unclassified Aureispira]|uniref:phosphoadenylyl-sulfate reductase n=1 Tax=unclassified Aureispira TaxID=2649989 RepID=UPI000698E8D5|nr:MULTISPECIES: phosphoadenylyl-sulfate reductase [unclassified Aureispira]WMX15854.1 phosphoadenylyl-sulfate reductase [Aureispira sp. CCB-E]